MEVLPLAVRCQWRPQGSNSISTMAPEHIAEYSNAFGRATFRHKKTEDFKTPTGWSFWPQRCFKVKTSKVSPSDHLRSQCILGVWRSRYETKWCANDFRDSFSLSHVIQVSIWRQYIRILFECLLLDRCASMCMVSRLEAFFALFCLLYACQLIADQNFPNA